MTAESPVKDAPRTGDDATPKRYLGALVVVARSARRREFVVVHFGSSTYFRTDRLGALAVRALIDGRSDAEVLELVERIEAGAEERARQLILALEAKGAMTRVQPQPAGRTRRRLVTLAVGFTLSLMAPMVRLAPIPVLAWMFEKWPSSPFGNHVWRSNRLTMINNLRENGYADRPESWLLDVSRRCAANGLGYPFMYLSVSLSRERMGRLADRLFDRASADDFAVRLERAEPTVGVFLHGPLFPAVPTVLRTRGRTVVRAIVPLTHGINLSESSGPLSDFFGDPAELTVAVDDPLAATGDLLRHLKAGRSVYIALDAPAVEGNQAEIEMLGGRWIRNDWPAWIAVRSGRPLALWTTQNSPAGVVVTASSLLHPDLSLPVGRRVAELSRRLYSTAEAAIRQHPEAWTGWAYLSFMREPILNQRPRP